MEHIQTNTTVIGGGPGGYAAAIRLGQLGVDTVLVEEDKVGGTCLNVGCIPSKALLHAAFEFHKVKHDYQKLGISAKGADIDWSKTISWKEGVVSKLVGGVGSLLKANKVKVINGRGVLQSANSVSTETHTIETKNVILASGSKILELPAFPFDGDKIINSTDLLSLQTVPKSMVILGGGIIGMELGNVYAALGCKVTIVEMMPSILMMYDSDASKIVAKYFENIGGEIMTSTKAVSCKKTTKGIVLTYEKDGKAGEISAEKLAVAVGRTPNLSPLNLETVPIQTEKQRLVVNDQFETSQKNVYAIGDLINGPMLAHKATAEGILCAEGISGEKISRSDIKVIPDVVYTKPEIAKAGMSESEAKEKGLQVISGSFPFTALGRAATTNESTGYVKYVAEEGSKRIVGVTIVSTKASEMISQAALTIELGGTLEDVALTVHPHPTFSEAQMEAAAAVMKKATHIFNKP